jgi:hypothetical protein
MVLCIAREGIHINRTENHKPALLPVRAFISCLLIPCGEPEKSGTHFSIEIVSLTGNP